MDKKCPKPVTDRPTAHKKSDGGFSSGRCVSQPMALPETPYLRNFDRFDSEGGVSYRELLLFCGRHAGKWSDAQPALADKFRETLRSQVPTRTLPS